MVNTPGCLLRDLSVFAALGLCLIVPLQSIVCLQQGTFRLSSWNLVHGDVGGSLQLPHFMKHPEILIKNLTHYTSFCVNCTNVLYNFDILVITQKKHSWANHMGRQLSSILNKSDCFGNNQLINIQQIYTQSNGLCKIKCLIETINFKCCDLLSILYWKFNRNMDSK